MCYCVLSKFTELYTSDNLFHLIWSVLSLSFGWPAAQPFFVVVAVVPFKRRTYKIMLRNRCNDTKSNKSNKSNVSIQIKVNKRWKIKPAHGKIQVISIFLQSFSGHVDTHQTNELIIGFGAHRRNTHTHSVHFGGFDESSCIDRPKTMTTTSQLTNTD